MRASRQQLQVIVGVVEMSTNQLLRCSDPRVQTGAELGAGFQEILFPADFRIISAVCNPHAGNYGCGVSIPSASSPGNANSMRINTQLPPNVSNVDATVTFAVYGYGIGS